MTSHQTMKGGDIVKKILSLVQTMGFKLLCAAAALANSEGLAELTVVIGVASASAWSKYQPEIPASMRNRN